MWTVLLWQIVIIERSSGAGIEDYSVTFPIGQIGVLIEFPLTNFDVILGDTISLNITIDQSLLPSRVTISDPDKASLTVQFTQRKLTLPIIFYVVQLFMSCWY